MLVFNRPEHTARVFEAVRAARPRTLLVVADGARESKAGEHETCRKTRAVFDAVDWPCEVVRLFSDTNMGCGRRIGSGITEVFERVDRCIFLEDDCLPDPTFFPYCEDLLERYADDDRVMAVSGDGFAADLGGIRFPHSYFFTRYVHIWGWATWRRAWSHFDLLTKEWPAVRDSSRRRREVLGAGDEGRFWTEWFERCHQNPGDTWDVPWVFNCWMAGGISICPDRNLVSNIGSDGTGTHGGKPSPYADMKRRPMAFPMRHPEEVRVNGAADRWAYQYFFAGDRRARWKRWLRSLRR